MPDNPGEGRRNFLSYFLGAGALAFVSAVAYPVLKYLTPPAVADGGGDESVDAGKTDQFRNNSGRIVKFGSQPALVVREENGDFKAFIAVCSHLGCTVQYLPGDRVIWCACHNGKYNLNGINISGPPPHPLTPLKVNVRGDEVFISREA